MATWVVRQDKDSWSVRCGRVRKTFDLEDEAVRYVREQRRWGDKVVLEESDGYRIPLRTRKHWRRG